MCYVVTWFKISTVSSPFSSWQRQALISSTRKTYIFSTDIPHACICDMNPCCPSFNFSFKILLFRAFNVTQTGPHSKITRDFHVSYCVEFFPCSSEPQKCGANKLLFFAGLFSSIYTRITA